MSRSATLAVLALVVILLPACGGGFQDLEEASAQFSAPATFKFKSAEEFNAFEERSKALTFSTELAGVDTCEQGRLALEDWAGIEASEDTDPGPGNFCIFAVQRPLDFPQIDYASIRVGRTRNGDAWVVDSAEPGGVSRVVVAFFDPK